MRLRSCLWLLTVAAALCAFPVSVQAHAHLIRADLAPDKTIYVPGGVVRFWFDEALNPSLSQVLIRDSAGQEVGSDTGRVTGSGAQELDVRVPALAPGQYTVLWTSASAQDGHVLHSFYVFTAGGPNAAAIGTVNETVDATGNPGLDDATLLTALSRGLGLFTATLWTGALAFWLLVIRPARSQQRVEDRAYLERVHTTIVRLLRLGIAGSLLASVLELAAAAFSIGGLSGVVSPSTLQALLRSQFGIYSLMRLVCLVPAMLVIGAAGFRLSGPTVAEQQGGGTRSKAALATFATLGALYLLTIALTGHAAAVQQLVVTSVALDWTHLAANSIWIGGMGAIALALTTALTSRHEQDSDTWLSDRSTLLRLLDVYSPAAFLAVPIAAITGVFNAQVHLSSFDQLYQTSYGRFLLIKLVLIAEMILISASHVFATRPRLRKLLAGGNTGPEFREAMDSLVVRLQVEPFLGVLVLLCVAIMSQVAPSVAVFSTAAQSAAVSIPAQLPVLSAPAPAQAIHGTAHRGALDVDLTIDPAAVGRARIFAVVRQRGSTVVDGQVRIKLSVPDQPQLGSVFVETRTGQGGYSGVGDIVQKGLWQADVLVRTRDDPAEFRTVPFTFLAGPGSSFTAADIDPRTVHSSIAPGTLTAPNTVTLSGLPVQAVQVLSQSLDKDIGVIALPAGAAGSGRWVVKNAWAPTSGRWSLMVQVRESASGPWLTVRAFVYDVPSSGAPMRLRTP